MGPSVTCLFKAYLKELFFVHYEHSTPALYKQYIDKTVGTASCSEKELQCFIDHVTLQTVYQIHTYTISDNAVTFLDLRLTIDNNHIKSRVHFKPIDSHNYLLISSNNPLSCKILFLIHNLYKSNVADFITVSIQVPNLLSDRQGPKHIIE